MFRTVRILIGALAVTVAAASFAQELRYLEDRYAEVDANPKKGGLDLTGPYDWVPNWLQTIEKGRIIHPVTIMAESEDRVFIGLNGTSPIPKPDEHRLFWPFKLDYPGARVDHQVLVVNRDGKVIEEWSQWSNLFGSLHKIAMNPYDPEKHIWILDRASQQILEFTNDGKDLVFTLGERGVAGEDEGHFNRPSDICWLPDGTFFVGDGFGNNRVVKYDKDGNYLMTWGTKGTGPGQFHLVDAVTVDANRRVYVTDRKNGRIQIFDENGKYLDEWDGFTEPMQVLITQPEADGKQYAWVLDGAASRFSKYDLDGNLLDYWGTDADPDLVGPNGGAYYRKLVPGGLAWPHAFYVDPQGNLYVNNGRLWRVDKYTPRKGAPKDRLMVPFMPRSR
jgi:6-bladed beta-propeller